MKKKAIILITIAMLMASCANNKTIDGVTYRPYGMINEDLCKNDSIQYSVSGWAVCSGIIFCEMIVPSVYTFGYNLWEPIGKKSKYEKGTIKGVVK